MRNIILIDNYIKWLSNEDILSFDLNALLEQKNIVCYVSIVIIMMASLKR